MARFPYQFTFLLPERLAFSVPQGRHQPCLWGCVLTVDRNGMVTIDSRSREEVFEQTRRFLRVVAKGHGPLTIAAVLSTRDLAGAPPGRDSYTIIVNADVAIARTAIAPDVGRHVLRAIG